MKKKITLFVLVFVTCIGSMLMPPPAKAQFPQSSNEVLVWSVRACYAEAQFNVHDCTALLNVIRKRAHQAHWPYLKMLKRYSVVNWRKNHRGREILSYKLSQKSKSEEWNEQWSSLVSHVRNVFQDLVEDPCPTANHWGSPTDKPKGPMRRVACKVRMANIFYKG